MAFEKFDWLSFLRAHRIQYVDIGPNVARGNVNIRCPWCGSADESHHLGISLAGKGWGCWRVAAHRGISPVRLIQELIRCSHSEAVRLATAKRSGARDYAGELARIRQGLGDARDKADQEDRAGRSAGAGGIYPAGAGAGASRPSEPALGPETGAERGRGLQGAEPGPAAGVEASAGTARPGPREGGSGASQPGSGRVAKPANGRDYPTIPVEFRRFTRTSLAARPFINYLRDRDYRDAEIDELTQLYDLRWCKRGPFANRIIFPVYHGDDLITWTGRALSKNAMVRYKSLSPDPKKAEEDNLPQAAAPISDVVWNFDELFEKGGESLITVEGPFDALRMDYFGRDVGVRATCLFGKNISKAQVELLGVLSRRFNKRVLLVDPDASLDVLRLWRSVAYYGFKSFRLKEQEHYDPAKRFAGDPAELSIRAIRGLPKFF